MDRNKRRVTYVTGANSTLSGYGMNEGKKKKKNSRLGGCKSACKL